MWSETGARVRFKFAFGLAAGMAGILTFSSWGWGNELSLTSDLVLQEEYDDNVLLSQTVKEQSWITSLAPNVQARYGDERTSVTAGAWWEGRAYWSDSNLNTVTQRYTVSGERRAERMTGGASGTVIYDTTLDSELQQTGIVLERNARLSGTGEVSVGYALTEQTQTTLTNRYTNTKYASTQLTDYVEDEVRWETRHVMSETGHTLGGTAAGSFVAASPAYRSQEWSASVYFANAFSERLQASLSAGFRWTRVESGSPTSATTDTGLVFDASLTRHWETSSLVLELSSETNPSGAGLLLNTTHGSLRGRYAVTDQATLTLNADGYVNTVVAVQGANGNSTFVSIEPGVEWRLAEHLVVGGTYANLRQHIHQVIGTSEVNANRVMARLTYEWYRSE